MNIRVAFGTFAVDWLMTETDGIPGLPSSELTVGAEWQWFGDATRLDGPNDIFPLGTPLGPPDARDRVRSRADRMVRVAISPRPRPRPTSEPQKPGFTVTDGRRAWRGDWVARDFGRSDLAVFSRGLPPIGVPLWVVEIQRPIDGMAPASSEIESGALPGLAAGTLIATPLGPVPVETLRPGDPVLTRDGGPQAVHGTVARRLSKQQLDEDPTLRPLIIERSAVSAPPWSSPVRVAPGHRVLVSGPQAKALFCEVEVLAQASHLEERLGVSRDLACSSVEYHAISLTLPGLISAGGHWCEAIQPTPSANTPMAEPPRRVLTASEAAILGAHPTH